MFFFYQYWFDFMRGFYGIGAPQAATPVQTAPEPMQSTKPAPVFSSSTLDPSRERILADALAKSQAALKASEARSAAFLSSMSHELRTPLNAIMGFADMMRSGVFGAMEHPTYAQYVNDIHASGAALLGKIDDLLGLACIEAKEHAMEPSRFIVAELLAELASVHGEEASVRGLLLRPDAPSTLEVEADREQLSLALSHLIGNALRHAKEGSEVLISARVQPGEGLIVSVRDSGQGIGEAQLSAIRAAMQQQASYHAISSEGIGLGLSVAHELARHHGGRIMIDSVRKRGTVASLILPTERITAGLKKKPSSGFYPGARKLH